MALQAQMSVFWLGEKCKLLGLSEKLEERLSSQLRHTVVGR
jgi:hypothetical protein